LEDRVNSSEKIADDEAILAPGVVVRGSGAGFSQGIIVGSHHLKADEPVRSGGNDTGPSPYEFLLAGLGACTAMTVGMYARRKNWQLEGIVVRLRHSRIHAEDCAECETKVGFLDYIDVELELTGALTSEQRSKLLEIAEKCPVHRTLESEIKIQSSLA
jgi:putative redox protein